MSIYLHFVIYILETAPIASLGAIWIGPLGYNEYMYQEWIQGRAPPLFAKIFEIDRDVFEIGKYLWNWRGYY
jgi:hypothetical protein